MKRDYFVYFISLGKERALISVTFIMNFEVLPLIHEQMVRRMKEKWKLKIMVYKIFNMKTISSFVLVIFNFYFSPIFFFFILLLPFVQFSLISAFSFFSIFSSHYLFHLLFLDLRFPIFFSIISLFIYSFFCPFPRPIYYFSISYWKKDLFSSINSLTIFLRFEKNSKRMDF